MKISFFARHAVAFEVSPVYWRIIRENVERSIYQIIFIFIKSTSSINLR